MKSYSVGGQGRAALDVALHVSALTEKILDIAEAAGVAASERLDLEAALAGLPWRSRRRVSLLLEGARVSAGSEAQRAAADYMLSTAADVWGRTPPARSDH